jgi:hypothetical protein
LIVLRIALALAPGGLMGDGIQRFDEDGKAAVLAAVNTIVQGYDLPIE